MLCVCEALVMTRHGEWGVVRERERERERELNGFPCCMLGGDFMVFELRRLGGDRYLNCGASHTNTHGVWLFARPLLCIWYCV